MTSTTPAAQPTERREAVIRMALQWFMSASYQRAEAAAQDIKGTFFKPGDAQAFLRDARDAESILAERTPPAVAPTEAVAEPVAWALFAPNGNIRIWSANFTELGITVDRSALVPLYRHPAPTVPAGDALTDKQIDAEIEHHIGCTEISDSDYQSMVRFARAVLAAAQPAAPSGEPTAADEARDAARYRWLARKVSAHGVIDGWAFGFPTHLALPAPPLAIRDPELALGQAIDDELRKGA